MSDAVMTRSDARAKIVDAAARLLRAKGPTAVTTRGVAQQAGVQAPTIYRLFGDKDGLLEAVAEHVMATYVSAKAAVVDAATADNGDPLQDLRAGWAAQIDFGVANPTLFRLLSDPDRAGQSPAAQAGRHVLESRVHRLALAGRLRVSERRAVDLIQAAGIGAVHTLLSTPPQDRDLGLIDAMFEAVLEHILSTTVDSPDPEPIPALVTLRAVAPQLAVLSDAERQLMSEWLKRAIDAFEHGVPSP